MSWENLRVERSAVAAERVKSPVAPPATDSLWMWFWSGLVLACAPMLVIYFSRMWRLEQYQYFPFAIGIVAWLAWTRSDRRFYPPANLTSLGACAMGGIAFVGAVALRSPWLIAIALVFFATACLASMRGRQGRSLLSLALPLMLLIRLPMGYDQLLVIELQRITTVLSSLMLDMVGIAHAVEHHVIQLAGRELFVAEACSGIQSVFTLAFLSTLLIAIHQRRLWLAPFYLAIALVLAVAGNVLRVTMVAIAESWWAADWATGWSHDLLGFTTLGISALFLFSFDQWIVSVLHPTSASSGASVHNPIILLWNRIVDDASTVDMAEHYYESAGDEVSPTEPAYRVKLGRWMNRFQPRTGLIATACVSVILLCVASAAALTVKPMAFDTGVGMFVEGIIFDPTDDLFQHVSGDFELTDHQVSRDNENPILGWNSDTWRYQRLDRGDCITGQFAISQTYAHFHELCICYQGLDWRLLNRYRREVTPPTKPGSPPESSSTEVPVAYALLSNSQGAHGYLWYASISASGKMVLPPERPGRLGSRLIDAFEGNPSESHEPIMMVQLWVASPEQLDARATAQITRDFAQMRQRIAMEVNPEKAK